MSAGCFNRLDHSQSCQRMRCAGRECGGMVSLPNGAGNPPDESGIKTDYLWREVLTRKSLTNAQIVEEKDEKTRRKKRTQVWPRYHQLDVVRRLDRRRAGLREDEAGSGKGKPSGEGKPTAVPLHPAPEGASTGPYRGRVSLRVCTLRGVTSRYTSPPAEQTAASPPSPTSAFPSRERP